jgi:hypothetical protein
LPPRQYLSASQALQKSSSVCTGALLKPGRQVQSKMLVIVPGGGWELAGHELTRPPRQISPVAQASQRQPKRSTEGSSTRLKPGLQVHALSL